MVQCPVCGMMVDERTAPRSEYKGKTYYFMNPTHQAMFAKDPEKYIKAEMSQHSMQGMHDMED